MSLPVANCVKEAGIPACLSQSASSSEHLWGQSAIVSQLWPSLGPPSLWSSNQKPQPRASGGLSAHLAIGQREGDQASRWSDLFLEAKLLTHHTHKHIHTHADTHITSGPATEKFTSQRDIVWAVRISGLFPFCLCYDKWEQPLAKMGKTLDWQPLAATAPWDLLSFHNTR